MTKFPAALSILAAAALAACSSYGPRTASVDSPRLVKQEFPYHAGPGTVRTVTRAPDSFAMAGTGASTRPVAATTPAAATTPMYRVEIWMDDGRIQWVDTDSPDY